MSILDFNNMIDGTGKLVSLESKKNIPFEIKRVFYIFGTNEQSKRGSHAHYNTKQYLISISGSCEICLDNGKGEKKNYKLDSPNKGLFQDAMIWGNMFNFSSDNVLLVLANTHFSEKDYIRDYKQFLEIQKIQTNKIKIFNIYN